jgi:hypothetical protein
VTAPGRTVQMHMGSDYIRALTCSGITQPAGAMQTSHANQPAVHVVHLSPFFDMFNAESTRTFILGTYYASYLRSTRNFRVSSGSK